MAANTAERLSDAALLAVREHGYAGMSMQDLLRSTGVSSSSMYHHFPGGKEELVATAVRRSGMASRDQIVAVFNRLEPADAVARIFEAAADELTSHDFALGCPIGVPATEAPEDSAAIRDAVADVFDAWATAYADGFRAGGLDDDRASSLGRFMVAAYQGSVTVARATRSTEPYRDAAAVVVAELTR